MRALTIDNKDFIENFGKVIPVTLEFFDTRYLFMIQRGACIRTILVFVIHVLLQRLPFELR